MAIAIISVYYLVPIIFLCCCYCFSSLNAVKLAYDVFKPSKVSYLSSRPPLVIIHGLFGGKRNWQSLAKAICRAGQQVSVMIT